MPPLLAANFTALGLTLAGLAVLLTVLHLVERVAGGYVSRKIGWNGVLLTGWLGVPVHELGHLLVAKLVGHRVVGWKLFDPDPVSGTLGYVRHAPSQENGWQRAGNFYVGIAPLLAGGGVLFALLCWMVPYAELAQVVRSATRPLMRVETLGELLDAFSVWPGLVWRLAEIVWEHRSAWLPVQIYAGLCVASHLSPSSDDLQETGFGALLSLAAVGLGVAALALVGVSASAMLALLAPLTMLVLAAALFQGLYALAVAGLTALGRRLRRARGSKRSSRDARTCGPIAQVRAARRRGTRFQAPSRART